MKLKPYQKIEIEWFDSLSSGGWVSLKNSKEERGDLDRLTHYSIGYFLEKTPFSVVICQSYQKKIFDDGDRNTDNRLEIPLGAIKKIKKIK